MRQREHVTTGSQDSRPLIVMIAAEDLEMLKKSQQQILERLDKLGAGQPLKRSVAPSYVTAKEFMDAVRIRRWKFNQLIAGNKIKTIKKRRKIYVLATEIDRFFTDPSIQ